MNQKLIKTYRTSHFPPHTSQKGITLIALVVTIIVMLILAGVVINMVTGDEGVISQAKLANKQQIEKEDMEAIKLAVSGQDMAEAMEDVPADYNKAKAIEDELKIKYGTVSVTEPSTNTFEVIINNDTNRKYTIPANRKIAKVGGTTTSNPTTTTQTTTAPTSVATINPTTTNPTSVSTATTTTSSTPTSTLENQITFTIEGVEYQAPEGITWGEWVDNSALNTLNLYYTEEYGVIYLNTTDSHNVLFAGESTNYNIIESEHTMYQCTDFPIYNGRSLLF